MGTYRGLRCRASGMPGLTVLSPGLDATVFFPMNPSQILIWNVRGLNSVARRDAVRVLVDSAKIDIICLQETKMVAVSRQTILSMLGSDFDNNFICLPSVGASGGILIAWRCRLGAAQDTHSVSVQFCSANGNPWWLTCIYGPQNTQEKIQFYKNFGISEVNAQVPGWWQGTST